MNVDYQLYNDLENLTNQYKAINNQNIAQHETIYELHTNSFKIVEVVSF